MLGPALGDGFDGGFVLHCSSWYDFGIVYGDGFECGFVYGLRLMVDLSGSGKIDGFCGSLLGH